jgi:hypothetical protein
MPQLCTPDSDNDPLLIHFFVLYQNPQSDTSLDFFAGQPTISFVKAPATFLEIAPVFCLGNTFCALLLACKKPCSASFCSVNTPTRPKLY